MPTTRYMSIMVDAGPIHVGLDEDQRSMYSVNLTLQVIPPGDNLERDLEKLLQLSGLIPGDGDAFIGPKHVVFTGDGPFIEIIDTGGTANSLSHGPIPNNVSWENRSAQVFVRGTDDRISKSLALNVERNLHGLFNIDVTVVT